MLRELTPAVAKETVRLFKPGDAVRTRRNVNSNTPFPPEVPQALNPIDGVTVDYWLARAPAHDVTLDVFDASGALVRHMTSAPGVPVREAARPPHPNFWVAPPEQLPAKTGENRTHWDLRYDPPPVLTHTFEINANPGRTPPSPEGPVALPGVYTLKLTVDGKTYSQTATVRPDPRSPATNADLAAQHALLMKIADGIKASYDGYTAALAFQSALKGAIPAAGQPEIPELTTRLTSLASRIDTVAGLDASRNRGRGAQGVPTFRGLNGAFASQLNAQDLGDLAPTAATLAGFAKSCTDLASVIDAWQRVASEVGSVNTLLTGHGKAAIVLKSAALKAPSCS
jgi:hypothetical protein